MFASSLLPDTLVDRSIVIRSQRRTRSEPVERFRRRGVEAEANGLRDRLDAWAAEATDALERARPELPDELDDRAQDAWEPLLAIADLAAGTWPEQARAAALALSGVERREEESLGLRLLADLHRIFHDGDVDRLATVESLAALHADEEAPWGELWARRETADAEPTRRRRRGRTTSARARSAWTTKTTAKGYPSASFEEAWDATYRLFRVPSRHSVTTRMGHAQNGLQPSTAPNTAQTRMNTGL